MSEFWKRWHISLSTWFRDYLYIPLGGNRTTALRHHANLMLVFLLSGLWHGANWTFMLWGGLHGLYLSCGVLFRRFCPSLADHPSLAARMWGWVGTFCLVCFAWIFFRAATPRDALYVAGHLWRGWGQGGMLAPMGMAASDLAFCACLVAALLVLEGLPWERWNIPRLQHAPPLVRWSSYYALVFLIVLLGKFEAKQFIYFQF